MRTAYMTQMTKIFFPVYLEQQLKSLMKETLHSARAKEIIKESQT